MNIINLTPHTVNIVAVVEPQQIRWAGADDSFYETISREFVQRSPLPGGGGWYQTECIALKDFTIPAYPSLPELYPVIVIRTGDSFRIIS